MLYSQARTILRQWSEARRLLAEHQKCGTVETIRLAKMRLEKLDALLTEADAVIAERENKEMDRQNREAARERIIKMAREGKVPGDLNRFAAVVLAQATRGQIESLATGIARVDDELVTPGGSQMERIKTAAIGALTSASTPRRAVVRIRGPKGPGPKRWKGWR